MRGLTDFTRILVLWARFSCRRDGWGYWSANWNKSSSVIWWHQALSASSTGNTEILAHYFEKLEDLGYLDLRRTFVLTLLRVREPSPARQRSLFWLCQHGVDLSTLSSEDLRCLGFSQVEFRQLARQKLEALSG